MKENELEGIHKRINRQADEDFQQERKELKAFYKVSYISLPCSGGVVPRQSDMEPATLSFSLFKAFKLLIERQNLATGSFLRKFCSKCSSISQRKQKKHSSYPNGERYLKKLIQAL